MTITITAELHDEGTTARLQRMLDRMGNRQGFFKNVGDMLVRSAGENFRNERGPDGTAWTPWAASTRRRRAKSKLSAMRILSESGALSGSIRHEIEGDVLRIGSNTPYAAIHQLGGTITKAAGSRWMAGRRFAKRDQHPDGAETAIRAHTITIPARPFLGVSAEDETTILEMAEDWLSGNS